MTFVTAASIAACIRSSPTPSQTKRAIPVLVVGDRGRPLVGASVVSSVGDAILDTAVTDSNGISSLVVEDDAEVSAHARFMPALLGGTTTLISQTARILPGDSSLAIRMLAFDEDAFGTGSSNVTLNVSGLPGALVARIIGGAAPICGIDAGNGAHPFTYSPTLCGVQTDGRYSVRGFATDGMGQVYYGEALDVSFDATSIDLAMAPDLGMPFTIVAQNPAETSFPFAEPYRRGVKSGVSLFIPFAVVGSAALFQLHGSYDSLRTGVTFGSLFYTSSGWRTPDNATVTFDESVHPPTLSGASIVNTNGTIVARWSAANDGDADAAYAVMLWKDSTAQTHVWVVNLPASSGDVSQTLPPLPADLGDEVDDASGLLRLEIEYVEFDYLSGYADSRNLDAPPPVWRRRQSSASTNIPIVGLHF